MAGPLRGRGREGDDSYLAPMRMGFLGSVDLSVDRRERIILGGGI